MITKEKKQYASGVEWEYFGYDYELVLRSIKKNYPEIITMMQNTLDGEIHFQPIFSDTVVKSKYNVSDDTFEILIGKKQKNMSPTVSASTWYVYYQRINKTKGA